MKCAYFGPITKIGKKSIGGYEAANRKNIDKLKELGVEVDEYPNPVINQKFGAMAKVAYIKLLFTPFLLFRYLGRKDVVVHATPLYRNLLYPTALLLQIAHLCRLPFILDLRAGSFIDIYHQKGGLYKSIVRMMLRKADSVTAESRYYVEQIPVATGIRRTIIYFPNLAVCKDLRYAKRTDEAINLLYFGRIAQNKGIDILLDVISKSDKKYHLYLAGATTPDIDTSKLHEERITYLGILSHEELKAVMQKMHFFVFPTKHKGEGQSNSLIEAMANGLIPITSNQGFCKEVIGDCGIALPNGCVSDDYLHAIEQLASNDMEEQGKKCQERIQECHNIDVEIPRIVNLYRSLLCL